MDCGRIVMLHGIEPHEGDVLKRQLRYLKANYDVVPLSTLEERAGRLGREVVLTFDDGLRNNFNVVYPILKELSLPATFFVCPDLMDTESWLWNQEARTRLRSLDSAASTQLAAKIGAPSNEASPIVEWMKTLPLAERESKEAAIRAATPEFRKTDEQKIKFDLMSWSELTQLDPSLVTIGSHTLSHPILSTLDSNELERQLAGSRAKLEAKLGRVVPYFCYPNGSHNRAVVESARKHYQLAVTTDAGFVGGSPDMHLLPRIPWGLSLPLLAWRMWRPAA
jgi:peptidoglycan/xylan/chitin deacetylase (PgdA/CDA1 family)